jgi:hypothetical protein
MNARKMMLAAALLLLSGVSWASFEELELGISAQAMGGAGVVLQGPGAMLFNPASVAGAGEITVTAAGRLPFTNMDFATAGLDGAFPVTENWTGALSLRHFGGDLYTEQVVAATMAGMLSEDMALGIQPMVCMASIADGVSEYGSATAFSVNIGFQVMMYDRWMAAASVRNPFQARLGESGEHLQRRLDAGVSYEPANGMVSALVLSRDWNGLRIHVGQSLPLGPVSLMAGVQSNPVTLSGGMAVDLGGIRVEYAAITHPQLDLTHQAGVTYAF